MININYISSEKLKEYYSPRIGEGKIGDELECISALNDLKTSKSEFVLIGLPEDIGVVANNGISGTKHAFRFFLKFFLNMQSNQYIDLTKISLLGYINFDDLYDKVNELSNNCHLYELVKEIDKRVYEVIKVIVLNGKIPICIGGGHNNSYGIIKGVAEALNSKIEVLNIDPHFDFRALEGRHSGNGFSYAYSENKIEKYSVLGFHQYYNNQFMNDQLAKCNFFGISLEEFIFNNYSNDIMIEKFIDYHSEKLGLEIDLDCVSNMDSSAYSPVGLEETQVRYFKHKLEKNKKIIYYHFAEGSPQKNMESRVGKFLAYLVCDIINNLNRKK